MHLYTEYRSSVTDLNYWNGAFVICILSYLIINLTIRANQFLWNGALFLIFFEQTISSWENLSECERLFKDQVFLLKKTIQIFLVKIQKWIWKCYIRLSRLFVRTKLAELLLERSRRKLVFLLHSTAVFHYL